MSTNKPPFPSSIPDIPSLSQKEVMDYKIELLLNINSLLLLLLQSSTDKNSVSLYMTKLHGNIQYLVSLMNANVQPKALDLRHIALDSNSSDNTGSQNLVTGMNKLYLLLTKLIELYP